MYKGTNVQMYKCTAGANQRNFWQKLQLVLFSQNIHLLIVNGELDDYDDDDDDDNDVDHDVNDDW